MLPALSAMSQQEEYSETITRSFPATAEITLNVSNKYGAVSIATWEKDSVSIVIDMIIKARDGQKLEKLKNSIDFEFLTGQYFITANTLIDDGGADIIKDLVDIAGNYLSSSNSVTINYNIMLPAYLPVKIENRFGDVYTGDMASDLKLVLSYGDLKSGSMSGTCDISVSTGNAEIDFLNDGQVTASYSGLKIKEAVKLYLVSRSSTVNIDMVRELKTDSRRDKYFIGSSDTMAGDGYFTDFDVTSVENSVNMGLRYGSLHIESVRRGFSLLNLSAEYADVDIAFAGPPDFHMDLTQDPDVTFVYPKNEAIFERTVVNEEDGIANLSGSFGQGNESSRVIIIAGRRCEIVISVK